MAAIFGRRTLDPIEQQLRRIGQQGKWSARIAHAFAGVLLALFSLAALIGLGSNPYMTLTASINAGGFDIPAAVNLAIIALVVPSCDVAALYAANYIRLLKTRETNEGASLHWAVIISVTLAEAGTYIYMASVYERPDDIIAWALVGLRAFLAPALAIYLSMARAIPVMPTDILHEAAFESGAAVIRNVRSIVTDPDALPEKSVSIYRASAKMLAADAAGFDRLIMAVSEGGTPVTHDPSQPPDGPGTGVTPWVLQGSSEQAESGLVPVTAAPLPYDALDAETTAKTPRRNTRLRTPNDRRVTEVARLVAYDKERREAFELLDTSYAEHGEPMKPRRLGRDMGGIRQARAQWFIQLWMIERHIPMTDHASHPNEQQFATETAGV